MKILWFANYCFSDTADTRTGTWLGAMGKALISSGHCKLVNIASAPVKAITRCDAVGVEQWLLPQWKTGRDGLPDMANVMAIKKLVMMIKPDILHVWGLESYYGLLVARGILSGYRTLLDIQGIRFAVGNFFMGNLTIKEQRRCVGIKEIIKRNLSPILTQRRYLSHSEQEKEAIRGFGNISYQSEWSHDYLKMLARSDSRLFKTKMQLREEFIGVGWSLGSRSTNGRMIFAMCAGATYKGLHILVRALAWLKGAGERFKDVRLVVGGGFGRSGFFRSGYLRFIEDEIVRLELKDNVTFLGAMSALQIRENLLNAYVFVHPSFIESYSLAVAEAMSIGTPCVISYAGAMPELAVDGESALYYPSGDAVLCAERLARILDSDELASRLSSNARKIAAERNGRDSVLARQLEIYDDVMRS